MDRRNKPRIIPLFSRAGVFVRHVGSRSVVANSNHVLFFNGNECYRVSHPVPGGDDCSSFTFDRTVLLEALSRYDPDAADRPMPFGITHGPLEPKCALFQQQLRKRLRAGAAEQIATEEFALDLLDSVLDRAYRIRGLKEIRSSCGRADLRRERAEATKTFLGGRFRARLSLAMIGRAVHVSPYHLARLFRNEVGIPIHQYVNRLRLGAALEQIAGGAKDLTTLALDLGYSSHSHFSDAFRRTFGAPPSSFRRSTTSGQLREMSKNLKV